MTSTSFRSFTTLPGTNRKRSSYFLALLSLGVKNIHLGPTLPAFLSPNVANVLVENFGIAGIGTVEEDIQLFFGK